MIPRSMADWPAGASSTTNLPDLFLRRIRRPIELTAENGATNGSSVAAASSPCDLSLDRAKSPLGVRYPLRSGPSRSRLRRGLGPSTSRRFQ